MGSISSIHLVMYKHFSPAILNGSTIDKIICIITIPPD
jgi:hypothetical protein